jgi:hypothetical protein
MSIQRAGHRSAGQGLPGQRGDDEDHWGDGRVKKHTFFIKRSVVRPAQT